MSRQLHAAITDAIQALAEGQGATLAAISTQADLVALGCVVAEASDHGRTTPPQDVVAGVVALFLEEAANSLEEQPHAGTTPNRAAAARGQSWALSPVLRASRFAGVVVNQAECR
ncbi:MAG: hypothetical protein ACRDJ3_05160 [Solirubrobacteraceae bacterium]